MGSGSGQFGKDIRERGIDARVVSFDPIRVTEEEREKGEPGFVDVVGLAKALPFANRSFDLVLACNSLPLWSITPFFVRAKEDSSRLVRGGYEQAWQLSDEETERFLSTMSETIGESVRVLKTGGRGLFAPFDIYERSLTEDMNISEIQRLFNLLVRRVGDEKITAILKLAQARKIRPVYWKNPDNPDETSGPFYFNRLEVAREGLRETVVRHLRFG